MYRIIYGLLPLLVLLIIKVHAQNYQFGLQQPVFFDETPLNYVSAQRWMYVKHDNVEIIFPEKNRILAEIALKFAAQNYNNLVLALEYQASRPISLILYPSVIDYLNAPQISSTLAINQGQVAFAGSHSTLEADIRAAIAKLLINDMLFHADSPVNLRFKWMTYIPPWFSNGLSNFIGHGWTAEDETLIRTLSLDKALNLIQNPDNSKLCITLEKSIWAFIHSTYGQRKLFEVLYMVRLTKSLESGINAVLGIDVQTLTFQWLEHVKQSPITDNNNILKLCKPVQLKNKYIINLDLTKNRKLLCYATNNKGKIAVYVSRLSSKELTSTKIFETGFSNAHPANEKLELPIAWSPNNNFVIFSLPIRNKPYLFLYNNKTNALIKQDISLDVQQVLGITWEPNQKRLILSCIKDGQVDLFYTTPDLKTISRLTNDIYEEIDPKFNTTGESILFLSNRDSILTISSSGTPKNFNFLEKRSEIYKIINPFDKARQVIRLTSKSLDIKKNLQWYSTNEYLYLSDISGVLNPSKYEKGTSKSEVLANFGQGVLGFSLVDKGLLIKTAIEGQNQFFLVDSTQLLTLDKSYKPVRHPQVTFIINNASESVILDTLLHKKDTTEKKLKVRYYYFDDDEDDTKDTRRLTLKPKQYQETTTKTQPSVRVDLNSIRPKFSGISQGGLQLKQFNVRLMVDPIYAMRDIHALFQYTLRPTLFLQQVFEDAHAKHRLITGARPFGDLRSLDLFIEYYRSFGQLRFFTFANRNTRFYREFPLEGSTTATQIAPDARYRYIAANVGIGAKYYLNQYFFIASQIDLLTISRKDLVYNRITKLSGSDWLTNTKIFAQYSNTVTQDAIILSGFRAYFSLNSAYSFTRATNLFNELFFDFRKYTKLFNQNVLAVRLNGAFNEGATRQRFLLGGIPEWFNYQLENPQELPIDRSIEQLYYARFITPLHGFMFNARNGSRFALMNFELRIPFQKRLNDGLPFTPRNTLQLHLFYDFGLAWTTGNPLSQKNPIDTQTIVRPPLIISVQSLKSPFVMGVGAGFRALIAKFIDTRVALAWPIEEGVITPNPQLSWSIGRDF